MTSFVMRASQNRLVYFAAPTLLVVTSAVAARPYHHNLAFLSSNENNRTMATTTPITKNTDAAAVPNHKVIASTTTKLIEQEKKDAKFWNNIAESYSKSPIGDEESYKKKLAITQEYFHKDTTEALEFGCGTGSTALIHAPYVKNIHAIDVSSSMIDIAKEKAEEKGVKNVKFETMGIDRLHARDGTYDVVLGLSILHLLPNKNEVISKVHQILKPGGLFISSTICVGDGVFKFIIPFFNVGTYMGFLPRLNAFTATQLKDDITNSGFDIVREFQPNKDKAIFLVAKKRGE